MIKTVLVKCLERPHCRWFQQIHPLSKIWYSEITKGKGDYLHDSPKNSGMHPASSTKDVAE